MLKSMTAFGRYRIATPAMNLTVEIKSVNSRYYDCTVHLPRMFSYLEDKVRSYVQENGIGRGKVEISISAETLQSPALDIRIDPSYADGYLKALRDLRDRYDLKDDLSVMTVAQNRDLFTVVKPESNTDEDWALLRKALDGAIAVFSEMRTREGARIEADIRDKIAGISALSEQIKALSEDDIASKYARLQERIHKILGDNGIVLDEQRLLTECALYADKIAIDEELVRLSSHFTAFGEMLSQTEAVGRKLDFLLQEINRETNTIGSKCCDVKIARLVVSVKSELEKIREQIQNIE